MRLLISAGGTGGGVYPALAVVQALKTEGAAWDEYSQSAEALPARPSILWVGSVGGMEAELVKQADLAYTDIPAAGVHGVGWRALPGHLWQLWRGFLAARQVLARFRPEVLFFTGGYVAVPVALAARSRRRSRPRIVLFVPDIEPGLALKALTRFADRIAVSTEDSRAFFSSADQSKVEVTGYPLRPELAAWSREAARQALELDEDLPVLLVVGGSTGARQLNRAVLAGLPELLSEMQVIHLTGRLDWPEVEAARDQLSPEHSRRYRAFAYLHSDRMGAALSAADLVLSRAGASTLGELPYFGLPAILVPYPYAWRYQQVNAEFLARRGAAVIVNDSDLGSELLPVVRRLLRDPGVLPTMQAAMRSLARPLAARAIAGLLYAPPLVQASAEGGV